MSARPTPCLHICTTPEIATNTRSATPLEKLKCQSRWRPGALGEGQFIGFKELPGGYLAPVTNADPSKVIVRGRHIALLPVWDRGVEYRPPTTHKGQPIGNEPDEIGSLLTLHLEEIIKEAEHFVAPAQP